jgi:flavodoxin I
MKALVVYDSQYGNTERIAQAIGEAIGSQVVRVGDVSPTELKELDLVIVGSPTHGGWYTAGVKDLLEALPLLEGLRVAAFDTRTASIWNRLLPFGYAAPRIARKLEENGGNLLAQPEGFVVLGTEGPLKDGELERAAGWARGLAD